MILRNLILRSRPFLRTGLTQFQLSYLNAEVGTNIARSCSRKASMMSRPSWEVRMLLLQPIQPGTLAATPGAARLSSSFPRLVDRNLTYRDQTTPRCPPVPGEASPSVSLITMSLSTARVYSLSISKENTTFNRIDYPEMPTSRMPAHQEASLPSPITRHWSPPFFFRRIILRTRSSWWAGP